MVYRAAADAVLIAHLLFIVFVVLGGFIVRRRTGGWAVHLSTVAYAFAIEIIGFTCPLTPTEKYLRRAAGEAGYDGGFIEHYIVPMLYPGELDALIKTVSLLALILLTAIAYVPLVAPADPPERDRSLAHDS